MKNDFSELQETMDMLKAKLEELQRRIDASKEDYADDDNVPPWLALGDKYYFIQGTGVEYYIYDDHDVHKEMLAKGLVFETEDQAEKALKRWRAEIRIMEMIGDRRGNRSPVLANGSSTYTICSANPFGCNSYVLSVQIASSSDFKTWLGLDSDDE